MKSLKQKSILIVLMSLTLVNSCNKNEIDNEKPSIEISATNTFPNNCDTLYFGEEFLLKMLFKDNVELGSYSIDIHQNFDHHSHSTEVTECQMDPIKTPINPFQLTLDFEIPTGKTTYEVNQKIAITNKNLLGQFDSGDYHFFVSLTDKSGWSIQKGLSIKILQR